MGPNTINDPAFLVTRYVSSLLKHWIDWAPLVLIAISRHMEDFVTWVDTSKLKRTVMKYNDQVRLLSSMYSLLLTIFQLDDFDLL